MNLRLQIQRLLPLQVEDLLSQCHYQAGGAPNFDKEKPIELLKFIEQMEDLFKEHDIEDDQAKKRHLGRYTEDRKSVV